MSPITIEKSENDHFIVRYAKWNEAGGGTFGSCRCRVAYSIEDALALVAKVMEDTDQVSQRVLTYRVPVVVAQLLKGFKRRRGKK